MKLKTLLLSSAAAFAVVGGAQAADLSVAEPVEYVKACAAFGAGFYYIPGSDTCLHIFGHVEFDAGFGPNAATYGTATVVSGVTTASYHSASWDFATTGEAEFDAKSMTDVGLLEGAVGITGTFNTTPGSPINPYYSSNGLFGIDYAWLSLGALKVGHWGSTYNPGGSYVDDFGAANEINGHLADSNHIQLSFKAASVGLALGIEDPREAFGTTLPTSYSLPLIDGNITWAGSHWSGFLSAGYTQIAAGSSWGIAGQLTFDVDANNHLILEGAYGDNPFIAHATYSNTGATGQNNGWSALASLRHAFSSTLRTDWDFSYVDYSGSATTQTDIGGDLVWLPYSGFRAKVGGFWTQSGSTSSWTAQVALRRDW